MQTPAEHPRRAAAEDRPFKLRRPIFILGSHKSGTSLLRSLFDGHPDLFVFPSETHFFEYSGLFWVDYALRRTLPRPATRGEVVDRLVRALEQHGPGNATPTPYNPYGDSPDFQGYDLAQMARFMRAAPLETLEQLADAFFNGLHAGLHGVPLAADRRVVEKSVENAEFADCLRSMYPDSSFIHIVRNPYAVMVALRVARRRRRLPDLRRIGMSLRNSSYYLLKNRAYLRDYTVIRYEDLVTDPEATVKGVAGSADLAFSGEMLHPTVQGRPWKGNSSAGRPFSGISPAPLDHWRSKITHLEIRIVNKLCGSILEEFGYERLEPSRPAIFPLAGENISRYLRHRAFLTSLPSL